jgi:hypothetical protein
MIRPAAATLAFLTLAFGCAQENGAGQAELQGAPAGEIVKREQCERMNCQPAPDNQLIAAQRVAQNTALSCPNNDCNPSVGLLSAALKNQEGHWSSGQCTAFLVAPGVVATNGHCVPGDIKSDGASCEGRIWITFADDPARADFERRVGCAKVLQTRDEGHADSPDYAYLQLEKEPRRPALRLSRAGIENRKEYFLHKVNPETKLGGVAGWFEKARCRSRYETSVFSSVRDLLSPTQLLVDCLAIHGNSGSPVTDAKGVARGLIFSTIDKEKARKILGQTGSELPAEEEIAELSIATSFACLPSPGDLAGKNIPAACAPDLRKKKQDELTNARLSALSAGARKLVEENAADQPELAAFQWGLRLTTASPADALHGLGVPDCWKRGEAESLAQKTVPIRRPIFQIKARYDKYLYATEEKAAWAGLSPAKESMTLKPLGANQFQVHFLNIDNGQSETIEALGRCPSPFKPML